MCIRDRNNLIRYLNIYRKKSVYKKLFRVKFAKVVSLGAKRILETENTKDTINETNYVNERENKSVTFETIRNRNEITERIG